MPNTDSPDPNLQHTPSELRSTSGPPRWLKVSGIVVVVLVALLLILMLAGSDHGPGRHGLERSACAPVEASEVAESALCQT